jgi:hypothetical protein
MREHRPEPIFESHRAVPRHGQEFRQDKLVTARLTVTGLNASVKNDKRTKGVGVNKHFIYSDPLFFGRRIRDHLTR